LLAGTQRAANQAAYEKLQVTLGQAQKEAIVECMGTAVCDKMWMLTKSYVQQQCSTAVRLSDESLIETFVPSEYERASFAATRVPNGDVMVIKLGAACLGMYNRDGTLGPNYIGCATQVSQAQLNFKHFLYQRM
jgi:hypothetical protein